MTTYNLDESEVQSLQEEMKQNRYGKKIQCNDCEGEGYLWDLCPDCMRLVKVDCERCEGSGEIIDDEAAR